MGALKVNGNISATGTISASSFLGNASSATKWATARTITIGNTGKSVSGDSNVSWSLAEIGAIDSYLSNHISVGDTPPDMVYVQFAKISWVGWQSSNLLLSIHNGYTSPKYAALVAIEVNGNNNGLDQIMFQQLCGTPITGRLYYTLANNVATFYFAKNPYETLRIHPLSAMGSGIDLSSTYVSSITATGQAIYSDFGGHASSATKAGYLATARTLTIGNTGKSFDGSSNISWSLSEIGALPTSGGTISCSNTTSVSWPLVLHQTGNENSTGWGPGIKFLNSSDSSVKWAGIAGVASSTWANNNDLVFYTSAEARIRMNNNTFYPISNGTYDLGTTSNMWNRVCGSVIYAQNRINIGANMAQVASGRAELHLVSITNTPCDLWLGTNSKDQWSFTARPSDENNVLGLYNAGSGYLMYFYPGEKVTILGNTVLHAGNYTSYTPTKTGSGASGTWNISITGNAATASSLGYTGSIGTGDTGTYTWRLVARCKLPLSEYNDTDLVIAINQRFQYGRSIVLKASLRANGGNAPEWSLYYENGVGERRYNVDAFQLAIYKDGTNVYGDLYHVSSTTWLRTTTTVLSNLNWTIYNSSEGIGATNPSNCYTSSSAAARALYGVSAYNTICKPSARTEYYTVNPNDEGWTGYTGQIIYQLID